jgi:hypothetical protein
MKSDDPRNIAMTIVAFCWITIVVGLLAVMCYTEGEARVGAGVFLGVFFFITMLAALVFATER